MPGTCTRWVYFSKNSLEVSPRAFFMRSHVIGRKHDGHVAAAGGVTLQALVAGESEVLVKLQLGALVAHSFPRQNPAKDGRAGLRQMPIFSVVLIMYQE